MITWYVRLLDRLRREKAGRYNDAAFLDAAWPSSATAHGRASPADFPGSSSSLRSLNRTSVGPPRVELEGEDPPAGPVGVVEVDAGLRR